MGGFDAAGVDAEFFPDGRFHTVLVVNIGHPGKDPWFARLPGSATTKWCCRPERARECGIDLRNSSQQANRTRGQT
jgi:hypothetical protein